MSTVRTSLGAGRFGRSLGRFIRGCNRGPLLIPPAAILGGILGDAVAISGGSFTDYLAGCLVGSLAYRYGKGIGTATIALGGLAGVRLALPAAVVGYLFLRKRHG